VFTYHIILHPSIIINALDETGKNLPPHHYVRLLHIFGILIKWTLDTISVVLINRFFH